MYVYEYTHIYAKHIITYESKLCYYIQTMEFEVVVLELMDQKLIE